MNKLDIAQAVAIVRDRLETHGRRVVPTTRFEEIAAELRAIGKSLNKDTDPAITDLNDGDTVFITIRGEPTDDQTDGPLDGFCCVRLHHLGERALPDHLARRYRRIYGDGQDAIDPDSLPSIARNIRGRVATVSDVFVEPQSRLGSRSERKRGALERLDLAGDLTILGFGLAALEWDPDWIYGFFQMRHAKLGVAVRYSVVRAWPYAIRWRVRPPNRRNDDCLLTLSRDEYQWAFEMVIRATKEERSPDNT
ncbi:MAG: hypothetical protein AAFV19_16520 [Pseudomonadota bacterium]